MRINNARDEKHEQMMRILGQFLGLKEISFQRSEQGEDYIFKREDEKELILRVRSNPNAGGFLIIEEKDAQTEESLAGRIVINPHRILDDRWPGC